MRILASAVVMIVLALGALACQWEDSRAPAPTATNVAAIIGGKQDLRYPAIGALTQNRRPFCTGTVIASKLIVTAAHCLTSAQSAIARGVSVQFRVDKPSGSSFASTYYDVDQIIIHPQYSQSQNDIGVISLKTAVKGVSPMALHTSAMDNSWVGRQILFLGYGVIQTRPQRLSAPSKQGVELTLRRVRSDRFTVQDQAKSICSGDSGGPAMVLINNRITLIGVNSYVNGNSSGGVPYCDGSGTAFRIDAYISWLTPYLTQYGGACTSDADCDPCDTCDTQSGRCKAKTIARSQSFCAPCANGAACGSDGKSLCTKQDKGQRCLQPCDANLCCPAGSSCQTISGQKQCVPDNNQCPAVSCKADADCGPGEACDTTGGTCQPKPVTPGPLLCKKCSSDADCGGGVCTDYPDGKYCTQPCVTGIFCPKGYSCKTRNNTPQCVSDTNNCACTQDSDCHTGDVCQSALCQRAGGGKYGDICGGGRNCAPGYRCVQGDSGSTCIQSCQEDFPPGEPGSYCKDGSQCVSGHRCFPVRNAGNICLRQCSGNSSCTNGGTCTSITSSISLCVCREDTDCKAGFVCNKEALRTSTTLGGRGQCAKKNDKPVACEKGFQCTFSDGDTYCLPAPSQQPGDACDNAGKRCVAGSFCAQTDRGNFLCIKSCSSDRDCQPLGGVCGTNGSFRFCNCNNGVKCSAGAICEQISSTNSICKQGNGDPPPPECQKDEDCGEGQSCQAGTCVKKGQCPSICLEGETRCQGNSVQTCGLANTGCSEWMSPAPCPQDQTCQNGKCGQVTPPSGCRTNDDCPARNLCLQAACVPVDCTKDADCNANFRCDLEQYKCVSTIPVEPSPAEEKTSPDASTSPDAGSADTGAKPPAGACGCDSRVDRRGLPNVLYLWLLLLLAPLIARRRR